MAPKGSLPCSEERSIGPYPEPDQSGPHHFILSRDPSQYYPPTYISVFLVVPFLLTFELKSYMQSSSPNVQYMPCPSHFPWLNYPDYTWQGVQVMKLLSLSKTPSV
jgi:hypothetical protein